MLQRLRREFNTPRSAAIRRASLWSPAAGFAIVAASLCAVSVARGGPYSQLIAFGDSLSDVGNIASATFNSDPGKYYWNNRFSNGAVYLESLDTGLGLPPITFSAAGGNDFAYGGAQTSGTGGLNGIFIKDVDEQVSQYLSTRTADPNALYVVFAGANDLINGQTNVSVPVNNLSTQLGRLVSAGARKFFVLNLPPLGYTPRYNGNPTTLAQYNTLSADFNSSLSAMLDNLEASNSALTIRRADVASLFAQAIANPAAFGLTNVTNPAAPGLSPGASSYNTSQIVAHPEQYLFWDDLHPTTTVHTELAQYALVQLMLPGDVNRDGHVDVGDVAAVMGSLVDLNGYKTSHGLTNQQTLDVADVNGDKKVNDADLERLICLLANGGGTGSGTATLTAVPEPASIVLLVVGGLTLFGFLTRCNPALMQPRGTLMRGFRTAVSAPTPFMAKTEMTISMARTRPKAPMATTI
jgi:thermolabile hemolysin